MVHAAPTPPRGKELRLGPVVAVLVVLLLTAVVVGVRRSRGDTRRTDAAVSSVASTLSGTSAPGTSTPPGPQTSSSSGPAIPSATTAPSATATPSDTATPTDTATPSDEATPTNTATVRDPASPVPTDTATIGSPPTSPTSSNPPSLSDLKKIPLVVVNNTRRSGLATRAATRLSKDGWTVRDKARYSGAIESSCVYYDPAHADNKAAAKALQERYPHLDRTAERFSTLPPGPLIVVLKQDLV